MAQKLKDKKAQVEASVPKLQLYVELNQSGFYNYLHQRVDILVARKRSALNPGPSFQQDILTAMSVYQIPLVNEINQAFNLQSVFPFAAQTLLNIPQPVSSAIVMENSLQVIGQKLLQKKAQVEASLGGLRKEVSVSLTGYFEYLTQRIAILDVAGGSIPHPVLYLQEEIAKASSLYQMPLAIALTEAFTLQDDFPIENRESTQQQASVGAHSGSADQLEDDDLAQDFFNNDEHLIQEAAEVSTNDSEGDSQMPAEESVSGEENPSQRSWVSIKSESRDDNPLAPPAGHVVDSGSIVEQRENCLKPDDESHNEDAIVEEVSAHLQEQEVIVIDDEEASFADEVGNDSNENAIMDETNDDEEDVEENMSDSDEDDQNDSQDEDDQESDYSNDDSGDDPNYEGNDEEEENSMAEDEEEDEQADLCVAGPSSRTPRRYSRYSARVTEATSGQEEQAILVSKCQTIAARSSKGPRDEPLGETASLGFAKYLLCTVPGCKMKEEEFPDKNALNDHLLSAHNLKKYRCLVRRCYGKEITSFATIRQFTNHRKVHRSTTRLACHCSMKFKSYKQLYKHYWSYHELGQFACSKAGCTFKPTSTRDKVMNHLANHREAKYECLVEGCDRSFKRKGHLDAHTLTHTGERPYRCPECDKSFTEKSNLTVHLRIHRNDKCYRCTWPRCGKSFNHKNHLTAHLRIHRNDKCYKCTWPQCTHSGTHGGNVLRHIRTVHFQTEEGVKDDHDPREFLDKD